MNEIAEFERRITVALERIGAGLDDLMDAPGPGPAPESLPEEERVELLEALEAERAANAQLTERVRAIKDKQETAVSALERKVAALAAQLDAAAGEVQSLKQINEDLSAANRALSAAAAEGVTEPQLINRSMMTELEALRAARAAEIAEMEEILSELKPLIGEVA